MDNFKSSNKCIKRAMLLCGAVGFVIDPYPNPHWLLKIKLARYLNTAAASFNAMMYLQSFFDNQQTIQFPRLPKNIQQLI